ncbi:MAG: VOC family protein [Chloroflexi bacterium]|nr:VOC family protein [Chloroflexota bacterium]MCL5947182.1 VOC family protein [Chloroflexota bacterium]
MAVPEDAEPVVPIDPATQIGLVSLSVADLQRSLDYYTQALGFAVLEKGTHDAALGAGGNLLVLLVEQRGARPWPTDGVTGLYHFALLLPSRADLGSWLRHYLSLDFPPPGQGDHLVSEAFYLRDPDGHGIEVYRDRPRSEWQWNHGRVRMATEPVDVQGMVQEADRQGGSWQGLPSGTIIGHIHLQAGDLTRVEEFYHRLLGFDVVSTFPGALFISAGRYHHHLGLNTWHSAGAKPAPADTAQLRFFTLTFASDTARDAVADRLAHSGYHLVRLGKAWSVRDPWGNLLLLHTNGVDYSVAASFSTAVASV